MDTNPTAPGAGSDHSHNVVPLRTDRRGVPPRERVRRTRERRLRIAMLAPFPHGAPPEIIEHRVNGTLCRDEDEMASLVEKAAGIDPLRRRQTAAGRFAPDQVAAGYEAVYREAARSRPAARRARRSTAAAAR